MSYLTGSYIRSTSNSSNDFRLRNRRVSSLLAKKIGMFWVIASLLLSAGVSYAIASTITVTTTTYSQILGSYISTTGSLTATDSGLATAALLTLAGGTSSGLPITFGVTPGTA